MDASYDETLNALAWQEKFRLTERNTAKAYPLHLSMMGKVSGCFYRKQFIVDNLFRHLGNKWRRRFLHPTNHQHMRSNSVW